MVEYKELEKAIEAERATKSCGYTGRDVAEKVCEFCKWIAKKPRGYYGRKRKWIKNATQNITTA